MLNIAFHAGSNIAFNVLPNVGPKMNNVEGELELQAENKLESENELEGVNGLEADNDISQNKFARKSSRLKCFSSIPQENPLNLFHFMSIVIATVGSKFAAILACNYLLLKGVVYVFIQGSQLSLYKSLGIDGVKYQSFSVIALTPWAMKGLIGSVSDSFALFGYHKRYYMIISCIGGSVALCCLGFLPKNVIQAHIWVLPMLFFVVMFQIATLDLLTEGKYTEKIRSKPETSSHVVTFVWVCITVGCLLASGLVGIVVDNLGPTVLFWISLPLAMHLIIPLCANFLHEEKVQVELRNRLQITKLKQEGAFFVLAVATAIGALTLAIVSLFGSPTVQAVYSIAASVAMIVLSYFTLPLMLANCTCFIFLQECFYISLSGALDFWYTADASCVPGGPSFDYTYYQTYTQLVAHSASILGLWIFQTAMSKWRFRQVYWVTTSLRIVASAFDLILVKRWNLMVGITDKWMYLLGDAIVLPITTMMNFMPSILLTARLCPKEMESTVYAILASFANFGANTAKSVGVFVQEVAGIETQAPNCNFNNLPLLIIIGHALIPALTIPVTFLLLPNTRMNSPLTADLPNDERIDEFPSSASHSTVSYKKETTN